MKKEKALEAIEKAIESHKAQMAKIERLVYAQTVENPTAVSKVQCDFGKWLYNKENHVQEILGNQFYERLDTLHEKWHKEYFKIFKIFFPDDKKGFFSKLIGSKQVDTLALDKARLYYTEIGETTHDLLVVLSSSQRRMSALSESKFNY